MWTLYIVSFESLFWSVFGSCVHDHLHIKDPFFQKKKRGGFFLSVKTLWFFSVSRPKKSTIYKYVIYIICMGACTYNIGERRKWWSFDSRFGAWQSFHLHANNSPPSPDRNAQHLISGIKKGMLQFETAKLPLAWLYYKLVQRILPVNGRNVRQGVRTLSFCVARLQRNNLVTFQQRRGLGDVRPANPVASAFLNNAVIVARQVGTKVFEVHMSWLPKPADGGRIFQLVHCKVLNLDGVVSEPNAIKLRWRVHLQPCVRTERYQVAVTCAVATMLVNRTLSSCGEVCSCNHACDQNAIKLRWSPSQPVRHV